MDPLHLFHDTAKSVPAYRAFLKRHGVSSSRVKTRKDFSELVPVMDKRSYLYRYPFTNLFPRGATPPMAYASSGSSGKPTFWYRSDREEEAGGKIHGDIFTGTFGIKKDEPTLVVICFSMGLWVAGNYTAASCRALARQGYKITVVTPGTEREDIANVMRELAPHYKNVVLAGYPPFLMDMANELIEKKVAFPKHLLVITAGDKFTESWREAFLKTLDRKDMLHSLVSIYGSADAGLLGYETPLSIFIRRAAVKHSSLYKALFGDAENLPGLIEYDPAHIYFESVNGELVFSTATSIPLVRYNIHDTGRVITPEEMQALLQGHGLMPEAKRYMSSKPRPFLVVSGRTDVAVTFYALNIYPENIKKGMEDRRIRRSLSGNYFAFTKAKHGEKTQELHLVLELARGKKGSAKFRAQAKQALITALVSLNSEYRKLTSFIGKRAHPIIELREYGKTNWAKSREGILGIAGKKPKVVL